MLKDHCRKVSEIVHWRVCNFLKWNRRNFCVNRSRHEFLEKEAVRPFQGEFAAETRLSEAQSELDSREWERRNADIALYDTSRQLESQRVEWNSIRQLNCLIHLYYWRLQKKTNNTKLSPLFPHAHIEGSKENQPFDLWPPTPSEREHAPPFDLLKYTQNKEAQTK